MEKGCSNPDGPGQSCQRSMRLRRVRQGFLGIYEALRRRTVFKRIRAIAGQPPDLASRFARRHWFFRFWPGISILLMERSWAENRYSHQSFCCGDIPSSFALSRSARTQVIRGKHDVMPVNDLYSVSYVGKFDDPGRVSCSTDQTHP